MLCFHKFLICIFQTTRHLNNLRAKQIYFSKFKTSIYPHLSISRIPYMILMKYSYTHHYLWETIVLLVIKIVYTNYPGIKKKSSPALDVLRKQWAHSLLSLSPFLQLPCMNGCRTRKCAISITRSWMLWIFNIIVIAALLN